MRAHVIGNATIDETLAVGEWPSPGASIFGTSRGWGPGGKGLNQAVVLARAGLATRLVAGIGEDARGTAIRAALATEPLAFDAIVMPERATDMSVVLSAADGDNCNITTTECAGNLAPEAARATLAAAEPGDLLVVQGNLTEDTTRAALEAAGRTGMVRAMNPSPLRDWQKHLLPLCDCLVVNEGEALALTGLAGREAAAAFHAAGVRWTVLTRGGQGALLSGPQGTVEVPAERAQVIDTTGAGDTFMAAALASAMGRGTMPDARALRAGARAAALTVTRRGAFAALPTAAELAAILRE